MNGAKDILVLKEQVLVTLGLQSLPDPLTMGGLNSLHDLPSLLKQMNQSLPPKSRLQLVHERTARGRPRDDAIQRTRLVVSIDRLAEDPNNQRKTLDDIEEMVGSVEARRR